MGNAQSLLPSFDRTQNERRYDGHLYYVPSSDEEEEEESELEATVAREMAGGEAPGKTSASEATGATTDAGRSQTGVEGATSATEGEKPMEEPTEPVLDLCGLEPGVGVWKPVPPDPPIRESRLTPEEKTKFLGHLAIIFGDDALLGQRLVFEPADVIEVMTKVIPYLASESMLIEDVPFDVVIVADIHGQLHDLHRIFEEDAKDGKRGWDCMKYLFLGDYVDRGRQSLEVIMALFCLKMLYPDRIFLLRGNHEFMMANLRYGFPLEIKERYADEDTTLSLYALANIVFCYLSVAAIVGNIYFCAHAGVSSAGCNRKLIRKVPKPYLYSQNDFALHDMMWADPVKGLRATTFNTERGSSLYFGVDVMAQALYNLNCIGIFRGHTMMTNGYDIVGGICVSLFSCIGQSNNKGAVVHIDAKGGIQIKTFEIDHARVEWDAQLFRIDGGEPNYEDEKTVNEHDDKQIFVDMEINHATGKTPTITG